MFKITEKWKPCYHQEVKMYTVKFWIFKRKLFLCKDWCKELVSEKEVKRAWKDYKEINK